MDSRSIHKFRPIPGLSREAEERQLSEIIRTAQENLEKAEKYGTRLSDELHELMDAYGTKDKEALALFHNAQSQLRENQRDLLRCRKARMKPYFGRIDFKDPKIPYAESYYVGRVGISRSGSEPVVIDWRAPIASVYYENTIGHCSYTVQNEGDCEIDLKRKRTYEIADDRLIDFFDSDVVANDELLTKYLARNKSAVLGEIIATIQKEQNTVIRRSPKMNLIVQGVAGSGKTTVAMHRISYILYNYEEDFRPEDFYIIGSNRILLNYITSVLPDLDVYGVSQMTMEQLFVRLLYEDWDPKVHHIRPFDKKNRRAWIKGSYEWFHDLERFCQELERSSIPQESIFLENGALIMKKSSIRNYIESNPLVSMQGKINMLNAILHTKLENEMSAKAARYPLKVKKEVLKKYRRHFGRGVWKGSVFEVYRSFLYEQEEKGKSVPRSEDEFDLYDLAALAYIYKRIKETDGIREASHVIIDEAQDFGMMAYGALSYCLRNCTYTIMGDVSQNIHYGYGLNDWEALKSLMLRGLSGDFGVLRKSYRNTVEISDFATGILRHGSFPVYPVDPIERHGNPVSITACSGETDMIRNTVETIRRWQSDGRETIAVICRDETGSAHVKEALGRELRLADSDLETAVFTEGVMVLPVEYTKGLEFDAVVLYDPSAENYPAEDGYVKLLYVAATRALHELAVIHAGDLTDLIAKPVSGEKELQLLEEGSPYPTEAHRSSPLPEGQSHHMPKGPSQHQPEGRSLYRPAGGHLPLSTKDNGALPPDAGTAPGTPKKELILHEIPGSARRSRKDLPVNPSPYPFGSIPAGSILLPKSESGSADFSIRDIKRTQTRLDLISRGGFLRLTPVHDAVIRVRFVSGKTPDTSYGWWNCRPTGPVSWTARAGKSLVELSTARIRIQADRRSGAIRFFDENGRRLLSEQTSLPRQIEAGKTIRTWEYFDWQKSEKLSAKGILAEDLESMDHKARYISFGGIRLRMPLLISQCGYGIAVAAEETVMCCNIPMYGTYLYTEGPGQIDYYFIRGENYREILRLYQLIQEMR